MSDPDDDQAAQKRAHWVSLRTLQRVPNVVGQTEIGEPIVEVGSARLVLPHGSNNFYRLSRCPGCGTERATDVVLTTAHLGQQQPSFCPECAARAEEGQPVAHDSGPPPAPAAALADVLGGEPPGFEEGHDRSVAPEPEPPVLAASLVSEVSDAVASRLESDRAQLVTQLADAVSSALERHRQAMAGELADALGERLQLLTSNLEEVVTGRIDEGRLEVMAQLESALGTLPDSPRAALVDEVATTAADRIRDDLRTVADGFGEQLQAGRADVAAQLKSTGRGLELLETNLRTTREGLVERLEEHGRRHDSDRAELASAVDRGREQLSTDVSAVVSAVERGREELSTDILAMASAVEERLGQSIRTVATGLERHLDDEVAALESALATRLTESQADVINRFHDLLSAAREAAGAPMSEETATSFFAVRADLYAKLDHVAAEATRAGMNAARVMLRATEQHVVATSAALADKVAQLETEVAVARDAVSELRRAVERMTRRMPSAPPVPAAAGAQKAAATRKSPPKKRV